MISSYKCNDLLLIILPSNLLLSIFIIAFFKLIRMLISVNFVLFLRLKHKKIIGVLINSIKNIRYLGVL